MGDKVMHETALMQNLITVAKRVANEHKVKRVNSITLSVGKLANAMPDALLFAFESMTQEGPLRGAELKIKEVAIKARCDNCGTEYESTDFPFECPSCKSVFYKIIQGEDIYIESLDCE